MYKEISKYLSKKIYPFHMPGHKGNPRFLPPSGILAKLDLTELPQTDILSRPTGIIKNFNGKIAEFYGAAESFFLVNGASAGVMAAILSNGAENLYLCRNSHISAFNAMVLCGAEPRYIMPEITADGINGGICPNLPVFDNLPKGAAVFITSPTYEGYVSDIAAIAAKVHAREGILIVDEAHGAHFPFHDYFPENALSCGADIVINSFHKTLPVFSACAALHVSARYKRLFDTEKLRVFTNALQTTSPSFMQMAACDYALEKLWGNPNFFDRYVQRLQKLRDALPLCGEGQIGKAAVFDVDRSKVLFKINAAHDNKKIAAELARKYKIQPEMVSGTHVLAITTVADTARGFGLLLRAVRGVM